MFSVSVYDIAAWALYKKTLSDLPYVISEVPKSKFSGLHPRLMGDLHVQHTPENLCVGTHIFTKQGLIGFNSGPGGKVAVVYFTNGYSQ